MNTSVAFEQDYVPAKPMISQQLVHIDLRDERVQDVLTRVREVISDTYADAEFVTAPGLSGMLRFCSTTTTPSRT